MKSSLLLRAVGAKGSLSEQDALWRPRVVSHPACSEQRTPQVLVACDGRLQPVFALISAMVLHHRYEILPLEGFIRERLQPLRVGLLSWRKPGGQHDPLCLRYYLEAFVDSHPVGDDLAGDLLEVVIRRPAQSELTEFHLFETSGYRPTKEVSVSKGRSRRLDATSFMA